MRLNNLALIFCNSIDPEARRYEIECAKFFTHGADSTFGKQRQTNLELHQN
jgi:hypothetical protein